VFKTLDLIGDAIMNADESVNLREAARYADFTNIAHQKAAALKQRIQNAFEEKAPITSSPSADPDIQIADKVLTPLEQCVDELHSMVGLASVKKEVETLINVAKIFAHRRAKGMPIPPLSFHLVLTGKTTVARIIAKIYSALGHLKTDRVVEVDRSGLVGNYIGQTANKTKRVVESAIGGVLFIDEAYSLARSYENDFGSEAIEVILKAMEDHRSDLVVIAAGYADRMDKFLSSNPGLKSRFSRTIDFPDYSAEDMVVIFERLAKSNGYLVQQDAHLLLEQTMSTRRSARGPDFANARDVRLMFEQSISNQANRIATLEEIDELTLATLIHTDIMGNLQGFVHQ
jgi:SpoVK/Ycf46/Vps4 family AAA+-type ATPase